MAWTTIDDIISWPEGKKIDKDPRVGRECCWNGNDLRSRKFFFSVWAVRNLCRLKDGWTIGKEEKLASHFLDFFDK